MVHEQPNPSEAREPARVLRFELRRRRAPPQPPRNTLHPTVAGKAEPADDMARYDLARYEEEGHPVDYRQRMLMNVIAMTIVAALIGAGVWLADTIADMQKVQDCTIQGRQNCAPFEIPGPKR